MFSALKKLLLLAVVVGAVSLVMGLVLGIRIVEGQPVPSSIYGLLAKGSALALPVQYPNGPDLLIQPRPEPATMRDIAFDLFNIRPQARERLSPLAVVYGQATSQAGSFDPNTGTITINYHSPKVFLHEYAHANFDQKPLLDKLSFLADTLRLAWEPHPQNARAWGALKGELSNAAGYAELGLDSNPVLEFYARLAVDVNGDLSLIPPVFQKHYQDFLQPGPNIWARQHVNS